MKIDSKQKGFTLIELMIVVAIIGILASIAIPQFASFRVKAFNSAASADLRNGSTAIEAFYSDVYVYPNDKSTPAFGAGSITLEATVNNRSTSAYWNISDGVGANYTHAVNGSGWCARTKHIGGNKMFVSSDNAAAPVPISAAAKEGGKLGEAGAAGAAYTTDCSGEPAATIAAYAIG